LGSVLGLAAGAAENVVDVLGRYLYQTPRDQFVAGLALDQVLATGQAHDGCPPSYRACFNPPVKTCSGVLDWAQALTCFAGANSLLQVRKAGRHPMTR
jgi:hypothetical protein